MKTLVAGVIALSILGSGCSLGGGNHGIAQILNDARWGLMAACQTTWVPADDCAIGFDALTLADGIVASTPGNTKPAVRQLLIDTEAKLGASNRLRPYLDAVIALLT